MRHPRDDVKSCVAIERRTRRFAYRIGYSAYLFMANLTRRL
jgi:hypothetical protein